MVGHGGQALGKLNPIRNLFFWECFQVESFLLFWLLLSGIKDAVSLLIVVTKTLVLFSWEVIFILFVHLQKALSKSTNELRKSTVVSYYEYECFVEKRTIPALPPPVIRTKLFARRRVLVPSLSRVRVSLSVLVIVSVTHQ